MQRQILISLAAAAALAFYAVGCERDLVNVDHESATAVSPYSTEEDGGLSALSSSSGADGGSALPCFEDSDCDDGDACTGTESCVAGYCRAGDHPSCFDGDPCTVDSCVQATGTCTFETAIDGTPCDDGNLCDGQTCSGGTCVAGQARVCAEDTNPCTIHSCDPATGACVSVVMADGASCSDGDACNGAELCTRGVCAAGSPLACDDRNPCTSDLCDPRLGCINPLQPDGSVCADGDLCNGAESCHAGVCEPGPAPSCDDHNPCTVDSCLPANGTCLYSPLPNGTACPDGNLCDGQTCNSGTCGAGTPVVCATDNDNNPCRFNACQPATGSCAQTSVTDGTSCSDGNICNGSEACTAGRCAAANGPLACADDGNPCTTSVCSPTTGCITLSVEDGTSCADSTLCNGAERCVAGLCTAGTAVVCTELRTCNPATGSCEP